MEPEQLGPVYAMVSMALQAYGAQSSSLAGGGAELRYKHSKAVFFLLGKLQEGLFASDGEAKEALLQLIFSGLQLGVPLVNAELLAYPKLRRLFFEVVGLTVQSAPAQVLALPPELFGSLMRSLEYGLQQPEGACDSMQVAMCLDSICDLAKYVFRQQECGGGETAAILATDGQHSQALLHFLQVLFDKLLFGDVGAELVDSASDLALALILCYESMFNAMVQQLLASRTEAERTRLSAEFGSLMGTGGIGRGLDRANRGKFRKNMLGFLTSVRGFLHSK